MYHNLSAGYKFVVFSRKYSPRCAACNQLIVPDEVVIINFVPYRNNVKIYSGAVIKSRGPGIYPAIKNVASSYFH